MTPREKIEKRAIDYSVEHPSEAPQLDEKHFKAGAEYGYNLAIENVVEWLENNVNNYVFNDKRNDNDCLKVRSELFDVIKQAMKL